MFCLHRFEQPALSNFAETMEVESAVCVVSAYTERVNDIKISLYQQEKYYLFFPCSRVSGQIFFLHRFFGDVSVNLSCIDRFMSK